MSESVAAQQAAWVSRVLGVDPGVAPAGMRDWQAARSAAIGSLDRLASAVARLEHPSRDKAIVLLRAIRANLTESPATAQQQAALRRYIETDDVIEEAEAPNGFGITVSLRAPLLSALAGLEGAG